MMNKFRLKGLLILIVMVTGVLFAIPTLVTKGDSDKEMPQEWVGPKDKVKLGLDLQGGMHLVLKVETMKAVENRASSIASDIKSQMIKERIRYAGITNVAPDGIKIAFRDKESAEKADSLIEDRFPILGAGDQKSSGDAVEITYRLLPDQVDKIRDSAVAQALETIRNRIDQFGVTEPSIIPQGRERIVLQLPGVTDPERAKKLIGKTAVLEFKLVDEEHSVSAALSGNVPAGSYIAYDGTQPMLLKRRVELSGDMLEDARMSISTQKNEPYVSLKFTREGARVFGRLTSENVGKRLAILLDGKIHSAPQIREPITTGDASISGRFTDQEASDLAIVLRAGSLPAPVHILEERTVGPSLGQDSIDKGLNAILIGFGLVVIFMIAYYKLSGLLANLALICNIVLLVGILAIFGGVLTLPGLAGIVLTIGMAVDANVIIFERIKEELRIGRTARMAVEAGYQNALSTILDANITTLIAAIVLFQFGTGPIRGFAVTLSIGIVSSLFTALVLCRWVMEWFVSSKKIEKLSI